MKVIINGQGKEVKEGVNILGLLEIEEVKMPEMVSVEVNGEIVDREDFHKKIIKESDKVEFLYFMGGGSIGA